MSTNRPIAFVADEQLLDDLLRLAAAAGCDLERVPDAAGARRRWPTAPLVLLDATGVAECTRGSFPRRDAVVVVVPDPEPQELWKLAMEVGAERLITLPGAEPWLVSALADAAEGPPSNAGKVLAVLGARGGAGASVFATAVSLTALRTGDNSLLIDCDPRGGGLDVVLGGENKDGLRWPDMRLTAGRVAASALHRALPTWHTDDARLTLMSGARTGEGPAPDAVAAVVEAGRRTGEIVVCDVPRELDLAAWAAVDRSDLAVIVVPADVRACVTGRQLALELEARAVHARLVVRRPSPGGLRVSEVEKAVGLPALATMDPERGLAESLDCGVFAPRPKGPLTAAARATLAELAARPPKTRPHQGEARAA
ncbi:septum site-determining protein Ssd [Actinophytocola sp. KF-1]